MTDDVLRCVDGLLHEETQVHDAGVDLTVATVERITAPGRVDFGGGELEPAEHEPVEQYWRHPDDDYQWWDLSSGQYLLTFNESLTDGPVRIQPRTALLERGVTHPTLWLSSLPALPLTVGDGGIHLKENARVSTVSSP
jgi:hypothetical protein